MKFKQNMITISLVVLGSLVAHAYPHEGDRPQAPSSPVVSRDVTIRPMGWNSPFLAATAPDDAIINGRFQGDVYASREAVRVRAQQVCSYYRYGQLIDFGLGYSNYGRYVTIDYGWTLSYAREDFIRPFRDQWGRVVGYAQGFSYVRCSMR